MKKEYLVLIRITRMLYSYFGIKHTVPPFFLFTSSLSDFDLLKKGRNWMMKQQHFPMIQPVGGNFTASAKAFIFIMLSSKLFYYFCSSNIFNTFKSFD